MFGRRKILALSITLVAAVALGVSAYLTWVTWSAGTVAGCTAESLLDCDDVLTSRWSKWFGLPVSLLGGLTYLAILGLCWPAANRPQGLAMSALFAIAMLAVGSAVWFVGLQAIQLQSFCFYCLTVHSCGLIVGVLALLLFIDTSGESDVDQMRSLLGVAAVDPEEELIVSASGVSGLRLLVTLSFSAVGLAALMGGQLLSEPVDVMVMEEVEFQSLAVEASADLPSDVEQANDDQFVFATDQSTSDEIKKDAETTPEFLTLPDNPLEAAVSILGSGPRNVMFKALPAAVYVDSMPMMGSLQAPHVMIEMMDYTCDHCRKMHPHVHAAVERYGGQLAVLIHHVPLNKKCNQYVVKNYPGKKNACDYSQLAIGVWKLAPEKFPEYHHWLLESKKPPNAANARRRAMNLVGDAILLDNKIKSDISKQLSKQATTFNGLKSGLPVLLFENGALRGVPEESQMLFDYLEATLGVAP